MTDFSKRVLVIEDDGLLLGILIDRISYLYSVDDAIDGEIAWNKLNNKKVDLILLDLLIPMMNGFDLLERIRNSPNPQLASVPVIIISNLSGPESIARAQALGISEYFVKSQTRIEDIVNKTQSVLEGSVQGPK